MVPSQYADVLKGNSVAELSQLTPAKLDDRLKALKAAIRQAKTSGAANRTHLTTSKLTRSTAFGVSDLVREVLDAVEELRELLGLDKEDDRAFGQEGCGDNDPCAQNDSDLDATEKLLKKIDIELLAELVFERMLAEVRVERERVGWTL